MYTITILYVYYLKYPRKYSRINYFTEFQITNIFIILKYFINFFFKNNVIYT